MSKYKVLVTIPDNTYRRAIFYHEIINKLEDVAEVTWNNLGRDYTLDELREGIADKDAVITGWGVPGFPVEVLNNAPELKFIAHAAGSVRFLCKEVFERGISVSSSNSALAHEVAEFAFLLTEAVLKDLICLNGAMRNKTEKELMSEEYLWNRMQSLYAQKISFIGFGTVARIFLDMIQYFQPEILVYDKYVSENDRNEYCKKYNIKFVSLEKALSGSRIIEIFCSLTEETYHLLDDSKLSLIQEGAFIINTARGAVIDEEALLRHLKEREIYAALDVFDIDPLPENSGLRKLDNVIITPHIAGRGIFWSRKYGEYAVDELIRHINGERLQHEVKYDQYKFMTVGLSLKKQ